MEREQLAKYKMLLESRLAQLAKAPSKRADIAIQKTPDLLDGVQLTAERELALQTLTRETGLAREIRAALARVDDGSYGACLNCEEEIKPGRLGVLPWAVYCVRCQEAAEGREVGLKEPAAEEAAGALHRKAFHPAEAA